MTAIAKRAHKLTIGDESINSEIDTILDESSDQYVPVISSHGGLTKREYFAAMAMHVWTIDGGDLARIMANESMRPDIAAKFCVDLADALIEALNKEQS